MIRVRVIEGFTLEKFKELKDIVRAGREKEGELFVNDTFLCDAEMAEYLTKTNKNNKAYVKVIEVIPEDAETEENASKKKQDAKVRPTKKKTTKNKTKKEE